MTDIHRDPAGAGQGVTPVANDPYNLGAKWTYCALAQGFIVAFSNTGLNFVIKVSATPSPMRLFQRNDGLGPSSHARLNVGGVPNGSSSAQNPGAPRVGSTNIIDPGGLS